MSAVDDVVANVRRGMFRAHRGRARVLGAHVDDLHIVKDKLDRHIGRLLRGVRRSRRRTTHAGLVRRRRVQGRTTRAVTGVTVTTFILMLMFSVIVTHSVAHGGRCQQRLRGTGSCTRGLLMTHRGLVLAVARSVGTPTNSVVNCVSLLVHLIGSQQRRFCLSGVGDSTRRLLTLIASLLSCRHLRTNGVSLRPMTFGPRRLLASVCGDFLPLTRGGRLRLSFGRGLPRALALRNSPFHVHRVIRGLLSGTLGFATTKNVALRTRCRNGRFIFYMSSAKYNVATDRRRHVFGRFAHLDDTRKRRKFKLKLSVAHGLMRLLLKEVSVRDTPKGNDAFGMSVPLPSVSPGPTPNSGRPTVALPGVRLEVTVVSSSQVRVRLARTVLRGTTRRIGNFGMRAMYYRRPRRLVRRLGGHAFSLMFASVRVPTVGKFRLLRRLHGRGFTRTRSVPIVTVATQKSVGRGSFLRGKFTNVLRGPFGRSRLGGIMGGTLARLAMSSGVPSALPIRGRARRASPRASRPCGFSPLATFSRSSPRTTGRVLHAFTRRARGGVRGLRATVDGGSVRTLYTATRGVLPAFLVVRTRGTVPLLG